MASASVSMRLSPAVSATTSRCDMDEVDDDECDLTRGMSAAARAADMIGMPSWKLPAAPTSINVGVQSIVCRW